MGIDVEALRKEGWTLARGMTAEGAAEAIPGLGRVLLETQTVEGGKGETSAAIPLHTDPWRAEVVAWYCHARAEGGDLLLVDAREGLALLDRADRVALEGIQVGCEGVLSGGVRTVPLVRSGENGEPPRVYYVPRLVSPGQRHHPCLVRFKAALAMVTPVRLKLTRGDLLAVDNTRMLHGRAALAAGSSRELTHWWIAPPRA